jgi:hypothetical protein
MLNFTEIVDKYLELSESSFFEDESDESVFIETQLKRIFLEQVETYSQLAFLQESLKDKPTLPFTDLQVKALALVANAALNQNETSKPEPEPDSEPVVKKIVRGRPKKAKLETSKLGQNPPKEDDEWVDSNIAMKDPMTGLPMTDPKTGKPLFLRVKKNPPKIVVPANYKPPPPPSVANVMAEQQAMQDLQKASGFKVGGGFTLSDLINKAKG